MQSPSIVPQSIPLLTICTHTVTINWTCSISLTAVSVFTDAPSPSAGLCMTVRRKHKAQNKQGRIRRMTPKCHFCVVVIASWKWRLGHQLVVLQLWSNSLCQSVGRQKGCFFPSIRHLMVEAAVYFISISVDICVCSLDGNLRDRFYSKLRRSFTNRSHKISDHVKNVWKLFFLIQTSRY